MNKTEKFYKDQFDFDVSTLDDYKSNTLPNMVVDLLQSSTYLERFTLEEGVKGTKTITMLNADVALQAKVACTPNPDGSVEITGKDLVVKPLYMGIEFCNEQLNGKITEILNRVGMKRQEDGSLPADLQSILLAYLGELLKKKAQRVYVLGDTTSGDAELALFDGLVKILEKEATAVTSTETDITASNAYDLAYRMATEFDTTILDNGETFEVHTGRAEALLVLKQWNDTNPYNQLPIPTGGSTIEFEIPLTGIKLVTVPELNGKQKMFGVIPKYCYVGTDAMEDMTFDLKWNAYDEKLKAEASFRLGGNIVIESKFTKLVLA